MRGSTSPVGQHRDHVDVGNVADPAQAGDVWPLLQHCKDELDILESAVHPPSGKRRSTT